MSGTTTASCNISASILNCKVVLKYEKTDWKILLFTVIFDANNHLRAKQSECANIVYKHTYAHTHTHKHYCVQADVIKLDCGSGTMRVDLLSAGAGLINQGYLTVKFRRLGLAVMCIN